MFFKQLVIIGTHETRATFGLLPITGTGPITMVLNDVRVNGTIFANTINCGHLNIDSLPLTVAVGTSNVYLQGFGFLDGTVSAIFSASLPGMIDDMQDDINERARERVENINETLNEHSLIDVALAILTGGIFDNVGCSANDRPVDY